MMKSHFSSSLCLPALGLLLGLATVPLLHAAEPHSAVIPVPRTDRGWQDRQQLLNQRAAEAGGKAQVIFIGDSITQGWENEGREVWAKYYARRNAVNLGIGGDRTQHVLWRLDNGNLNGIKPKAAVVMIGTNNSNGEDNTPGQIADGVTAIVRKLREKLPETKILLLAIFPRGENFNNQRGKILQINQVLAKLADDRHIFWIDFGHKFVTAEGLIPRDLMPDYLHLSPKAYQIWAESIEPKLAEILGDGGQASVVDPSGEWVWRIQGPHGEMIEAPLHLKKEGARITGTFHAGEDRKLPIESGSLTDHRLALVVRRQRPQGELKGGEIRGEVETEIEGRTQKQAWSARRQ